jgi:hypothetical protein
MKEKERKRARVNNRIKFDKPPQNERHLYQGIQKSGNLFFPFYYLKVTIVTPFITKGVSVYTIWYKWVFISDRKPNNNAICIYAIV